MWREILFPSELTRSGDSRDTILPDRGWSHGRDIEQISYGCVNKWKSEIPIF